MAALALALACAGAGALYLAPVASGPLSPLAAGPASAQEPGALPKLAGAARTVALFDRICYETTPDFSKIEHQASQDKWKAVTGDALKAYAPQGKAELLKAWTFQDMGQTFHVSIARSVLDSEMKQAMPAFANGQSYSCSLNLPGKAPSKDIAEAMHSLIGRGADESFDQPPFAVQFWSGVTEDLAAMVYYYQPKSGKPGGLLSLVVLKK